MPAPEVSFLRQKAVLLPATGTDDYGRKSVGTAVEIDCRWINKRSEVLAPNGQTIAVDATVIVKREIPIGSVLWLGRLADWAGTGFGEDDGTLMESVSYNETPDLKARVTRRTVGLIRRADALPGE